MKSGVVLLLCVSTHVLLVCATAETTSSTDEGTSPLSSVNLQPSTQAPAEDVPQDASPLVEKADNLPVNKDAKIAGVFLNFTRDLANFTNSAFGKNQHSSDETEHEEDVRIQDLLRGILADEFGSEEDEMNDDSDSDELDVFHDELDEFDDSPSPATVPTVEGSSTSESTDSPNEIEAESDSHDDQDEHHIEDDHPIENDDHSENDHHSEDDHPSEDDDDDDEHDAAVNKEVEADETASERTSRSDTVETTESGEREARSRELKSKRRGAITRGRGRGKKNKNGKKKGKSDAAKYNSYVDAVFKRMNTLIRNKRMDPLRVNLYAGNSNGNKRIGAKVKKSGGRGVGANNKRGKPGNRRGNAGHFNPKNNRRNNRPRVINNVHASLRPHNRGRREEPSKMDNKMRPISMESLVNKTTTAAPSTEVITGSSESKEMKQNQEGSSRPTRGVLHGLSTLRRTGPVKVVRRGQNTRIVRTKFLLGPVALEILSKKSNSTKSNSPSATATARSLKGVLEIRLKNSGPTRIRRLRVFPPSNVRVEGESNGMKKQGYRKITPVAARRLMSVANQVVRQSDRHRAKPSKKKGARNPARNTGRNPAGRKGQKKNNRKFGK